MLKNTSLSYDVTGACLLLPGMLSYLPPSGHGVSYMETAKMPAILYSCTGDPLLLEASVNAFQKLDKYNMLVDGVPCTNELLSGKNGQTAAHETCDIADYPGASDT